MNGERVNERINIRVREQRNNTFTEPAKGGGKNYNKT